MKSNRKIIYNELKKSIPLEGIDKVVELHWNNILDKDKLPNTINGEQHFFDKRRLESFIYKQTSKRIRIKADPHNGKNKIEDFLSNPIRRFEKIFDEKSNIIKMSAFNGKDLLAYTNYINDESGNNIKLICHSPNGKMKYKFEYEYDSYGNQTKIISEWSGREVRIVERQYDYNESIVLIKHFENVENKRILKKESEYIFNKDDNHIIERTKSKKPEFIVEHHKRFDLHNNLIEQSKRVGDKTLLRYLYTYEYDHKGNWVQRKLNSIGQKLNQESLTIRKIEYR